MKTIFSPRQVFTARPDLLMPDAITIVEHRLAVINSQLKENPMAQNEPMHKWDWEKQVDLITQAKIKMKHLQYAQSYL